MYLILAAKLTIKPSNLAFYANIVYFWRIHLFFRQ